MKKAKQSVKQQGGKYNAKTADCGCEFVWYCDQKRIGAVIKGGDICDNVNTSNHPSVYVPTKTLVQNGDALQMFKMWVNQ